MRNDTTTLIYTRVGGELRDRFENWRRAQPLIPPRSEALRSLLDKALTAPGSAGLDAERAERTRKLSRRIERNTAA
jgi:hypothetical protein